MVKQGTHGTAIGHAFDADRNPGRSSRDARAFNRLGGVLEDLLRISAAATETQRLAFLATPATEVGPNDDFCLKMVGHAREHDVVYKVRP
jgi:hypothetical protein